MLLLVLAAGVPACALLAPFDERAEQVCSTGDPTAHEGCDWSCNVAEAPRLRVTALPVHAPHGLATDFARVSIAIAIEARWFAWLLEIDPDGGFRTGSGQCDEPTRCRFDDVPPPGTGTAAFDPASGDLRIPEAGTMDLGLAVRLTETPDLIVLPLRELSIEGQIGHGGNCVGGFVDGGWREGASLTAKIPLEESRSVWVAAFERSLCDLLADADCANTEPTTWDHPPDTTIGAESAWALEADMAALGVAIDP